MCFSELYRCSGELQVGFRRRGCVQGVSRCYMLSASEGFQRSFKLFMDVSAHFRRFHRDFTEFHRCSGELLEISGLLLGSRWKPRILL